MTEKRVNIILDKLLSMHNDFTVMSANLSAEEITWLCYTVKSIFLEQPILLELRPPIQVCGDIHGQYHDLLRLFEIGGVPPAANYLFLGNYVDYGRNSIDTISLLFCYKVLYPNNFFLLRGSHECSYINRLYGFYDDCLRLYTQTIWRTFSEVFNCLPIAAIIDDKIFCVHGGISPNLESLDDINNLPRPMEVPEEGLLHDLLWSNPDNSIYTWDWDDDDNSLCFGEDPVDKFIEKFNFDLICRGHQAIMNGYEFPFFPTKTLTTIFSAPNFQSEYDNKGAILKIDENIFCTFSIIEPVHYPTENELLTATENEEIKQESMDKDQNSSHKSKKHKSKTEEVTDQDTKSQSKTKKHKSKSKDEESQQKITELEKKLKKSEDLVKESNKTIKDLEKNLKESESKMKESNETINKLEKNLKESENKMKESNKTIKDLEKNLKESEELVKESNETISKLEKELEESKEKSKNLQSPSVSYNPFEEMKDDPNASHFIGEDDSKFYQIVKKIGEGATSVTYKVVDTRTNEILCKKTLKAQNDDSDFKNVQNAYKEFGALCQVRHPSICRAIGMNIAEPVKEDEDDSDTPTTISIYLEFLSRSLKESIDNKLFDNTLKARIVIEIVHAINFIHKHNMIHRNIKIENIMLNSCFEAKIVDFGLVRIDECFSGQDFMSSSLTKGIGAFAYMSPEMANEENYSSKVDVYSFGMVLHYIFAGKLPAYSMKDKMQGKPIPLPEESESISQFCIDLISKCTESMPDNRPSFEEILDDIRAHSYALASEIDKSLVKRRDSELSFYESIKT